MDKKIIKDHLTKRFLSEEVTPGISTANKIKKDNAKINKDGVKDEAKNSLDYNKSLKQDKDTSKMAPNKYSYDDKFEKTYHDEMEIMNGQEMIQYDSKPDSRFTERALDAIEGSAKMGNQGGIGNAQATWGASSDDFGKNLVKRIKSSEKKRNEQTPTLNLRGRDIQADIKDTGHKPYAFEKSVKEGVNELTKGYVNKIRTKVQDFSNDVDSPTHNDPIIKNRMSLATKKLGQYINPEIKSYVERLGGGIEDSTTSETIILTFPKISMNPNEQAKVYVHVTPNKAKLENGTIKDVSEKIQTLLPKIISKIQADMASPKEPEPNSPNALENKNNNNNNPQIKESMKRLKFKSEFNGVGNALKLIPEGYKVDNKVFEMTDGNETYRIRWEGNLSEGKAVVLTASDKKMVNEDINRMKELFGYKSQETLGLVKGNARINENKVFGDIWNKSKQLLGESEEIESADATEGNLDTAVSHAAEAKKHVEGSVSTDKGTQAPKAKEGDASKAVSQAPEAKKHVEGSASAEKGTQAPAPKQGHWEDAAISQAAEAKKHVHLKEAEMEEEMMDEETMEDESLMKEIEEDMMKYEMMKGNMMEEEGEEEEGEEEEDSWNKPEADDDSSDEKEPTAADIKKTGIPIGADDNEEDDIVVPTIAKSNVRLLQSPSTGEYWIDNNGVKSKVPDMYINIASDKSKKGAQKAAIILKKMEADAEYDDDTYEKTDFGLDEYAETHQNPETGETHHTTKGMKK
jgi:hypothetical protein